MISLCSTLLLVRDGPLSPFPNTNNFREMLSRFVIVNTDPKKQSTRDEWGLVYYDRYGVVSVCAIGKVE